MEAFSVGGKVSRWNDVGLKCGTLPSCCKIVISDLAAVLYVTKRYFNCCLQDASITTTYTGASLQVVPSLGAGSKWLIQRSSPAIHQEHLKSDTGRVSEDKQSRPEAVIK